MDKKMVHGFGKDNYLLGKDENGINYWLGAPSWDCDWYWGFGYVETYTNNKSPQLSRDINSHQHYDGLFLDRNDKGDYVYHINDKGSILVETVLTDKEAWELADLMKRFYTLKDAAAIFHRGTANYTNDTETKSKDEDIYKLINEKFIPAITARVMEILTPNK